MSESERLFAEAQALMPGGVNSPVRAFRAVGGTPVFFRSAKGATLTDVDGNEYLDLASSWGAVIHGHANAEIEHALIDAARNGTSFGAPHAGEVALAREVLRRMPGLERVRFVNSGTEAALAVVRLARAATGRPKILKFAGNYHGAVDSLLARAGSGVATLGLPDSAGVLDQVTVDTVVVEFNDIDSVAAAMNDQVAAVLVEPVAGNMGLVPPAPGFLSGLRTLAEQNGSLLIFDEVMTGFRVARGGATERYGVNPDLVMMGKVIGGGLPVGAYGGRKDLMDLIAPVGPVYQAGTLSGNPLAMAAGFAALQGLRPDVYAQLEARGAQLEAGLCVEGVTVQRVGSMISVFLGTGPVTNYAEAQGTDRARFGRLFHAMLKRGVYLPPSALEAWFLTAAHTEEDIERVIRAFRECLVSN